MVNIGEGDGPRKSRIASIVRARLGAAAMAMARRTSRCWGRMARMSTWTPPADAARGGTADLCDVHVPEPVDVVTERKVQIAQPIFRDLGGRYGFHGKVSTVRCFENNPLVRAALEEPGEGRVLVVDGGASLRCAVLGDNLAAMAVKNGWNGVLVNGCIRDSEDIGKMDLGVKAIATHPLKSSKRDKGLRDVPVSFAGVQICPGDYLYADKDGVLVSKKPLVLE